MTTRVETTSLTVTAPRKDLVEAANHHHVEAVRLGLQALGHAIQAGEVLAQLKADTPHGEWLESVRGAGLQFSGRTARLYIRIFEHRDLLKRRFGEVLSIRQAEQHIRDFDFFVSKLPKPGERVMAVLQDGVALWFLGSRKLQGAIYYAQVDDTCQSPSWCWDGFHLHDLFNGQYARKNHEILFYCLTKFRDGCRPQDFQWNEPELADFPEVWHAFYMNRNECGNPQVLFEDIVGLPVPEDWHKDKYFDDALFVRKDARNGGEKVDSARQPAP